MQFPKYPYKDPSIFNDLMTLTGEIDKMLAFLEKNVALLKGSRMETKLALEWYNSQIGFLKQYYERAERLVHNE